jgi:flagellar biosynthesis anti-sigma factor FlgM
MKGITSNPALDAYQRMAISPVGPSRSTEKTAATTSSATAAAPQQAAKVSISKEARMLAAGAPGAASDTEKVARLKAEVESGQAKFDSTQVAEKMIAALG